MWRLFSFVILLIASSICILPLPSRCDIIRSNKIRFSHNSHMATRSSRIKSETSVERIGELGNSMECPFTVKENMQTSRIPSMFYELECLYCKSRKKGKTFDCLQLETEMEVVFLKEDGSWSKPENLTVKAGCTRSPVLNKSAKTRH